MKTIWGMCETRAYMINIKDFFKNSCLLDHMILRPLWHIKPNWELTWNGHEYEPEEDSYASLLNKLIDELSQLTPPLKYHDHEDRLVEFMRDKSSWDIKKVNGRWVGESYGFILEQGGFSDIDQKDLKLAVVGRIKAAIDRGQRHFDDMEDGHQKMLGDVLTIIMYHQSDDDA